MSLVIFPMTIRDGWSAAFGGKRPIDDEEFEKIKREISLNINVTIYNLGNSKHIEQLLEELINYFI